MNDLTTHFFVGIVGVIVEANGPDEAKEAFMKAVDAASDHAVIVYNPEAPVAAWPCVVESNFVEALLDSLREAVEKSGKPTFAIKKREGYSELVMTKTKFGGGLDQGPEPFPRPNAS